MWTILADCFSRLTKEIYGLLIFRSADCFFFFFGFGDKYNIASGERRSIKHLIPVHSHAITGRQSPYFRSITFVLLIVDSESPRLYQSLALD